MPHQHRAQLGRIAGTQQPGERLQGRHAAFRVVLRGGGPERLELLAQVLVPLASALYGDLQPGTGAPGTGGRLLASGIFADREPEVRRAFNAAGFHIAGRLTDGDWVLLEAERID